MEWTLITRRIDPSLVGLVFDSPRVRAHIRSEGGARCVWCAIKESGMGGFRNFHTEHYRPQKKFPHLVNSIENLFYSCSICGGFKGDDWPGDPDDLLEISCYPDPSIIDYSTIFQVNENNGEVEGLFNASKYMVERLCFNRPQLILERRRHSLNQKLTTLVGSNASLNEKLITDASKESLEYLAKMVELSGHLHKLRTDFENLPPYEPADVRRQ